MITASMSTTQTSESLGQMNISLGGDGGTSTISQSDKYKICRQIRQQQVENYLQFIAREEKENDSNGKGQEKKKKHGDKEQKKKEKQDKKGKKKGRKKGVTFGPELCLQSHVEDLDEKEVLKALKTEANFNFSTGNGISLLHKACGLESVPMVELLLAGGSNVNCYDDDWWTPLHIACYHDSKDVVNVLLKHGADTTFLDVDGNFALDLCVQGTETWDMMIQHMEKQGLSEERMKQIRGRQCRLMEADIKSSILLAADLDRVLYDGVTLLHIASANGFLRVTNHLLRKGASTSCVDNAGMTPLHLAAKFTQVKTAGLLIKHGADTGAKDLSGNRPIDLASSPDIQKILLAASGAKQRRVVNTETLKDVDDNNNNGNDIDDNDDDDAGDYERPKDMGSITSKMIYSPSTPMAKADRLTEARVLRQSSEEGVGGHHYETIDESYSRGKGEGQEGGGGDDNVDEYEDDEDIYYSAIWRTEVGEKVNLPDKSPSDDLSQLALMDETVVLKTLVDRYLSGTIYTNIGDILVAMNPFTNLPIYGKNVSTKYHKSNQPLMELTPHIYTMGESLLRHSLATGLPQCCLIGGESGSGKTETCKHLVQHVLWMAGSTEADLTLKLAQVNILLEAFGNARTLMNSNSSRFAKYLTLHLSHSGKVVGGQISQFLLEKSRVVRQGKGEANFHIFEWMLAGLNPEEAKQFYLYGKEVYRYLKKDKATPLTDGDTNVKAKFWEVKECLNFIGFSPEDVRSVLTTLSAILHLGNIHFETDRGNDDVANIHNLETTYRVADLLRVPEEDLVPALLEDIFVTRGEQTKKPLSPSQARDSVDALAKALYSRLFSWIVNGLNQMVHSPELQESQLRTIGILDVFGFENLNNNHFEQMCINVANEKLQSFYNSQVFEIEMRDCISEGLPYVDVVLPGNQQVISLFMAKNEGIFDLLDEESKFPKATDESLANKLRSVLAKPFAHVYKTPRYGGAEFAVVHYAGLIKYDLNGILNANRDTLRPALSFVMRTSASLVVKDLFQSNTSHTGSLNPSKRQRVSRHMKGAKSPFDFFKKLKMSKKENAAKKAGKIGTTAQKRSGNTLTCHFKNSLQELMHQIESSTCHFVRCVKPTKERQPLTANKDYVQGQLYYTGVLDTVKIRKAGYALRATFPHFLKLYPTLTFMTSSKEGFVLDHVASCNKLLEAYKISDFMVGRTKLFIKQQAVNKLDDLERQTLKRIIQAQNAVRQFLSKARLERLRQDKALSEMEVESLVKHMDQKQGTILDQLAEFNDRIRAWKQEQDTVREQDEYLEILDNVLEEYSEPTDPTVSRRQHLVFDRENSNLATHDAHPTAPAVLEPSLSFADDPAEGSDSSLLLLPPPPPPPLLTSPSLPPTTVLAGDGYINKLPENILKNLPPPPTRPPPRHSREITETNKYEELGQGNLSPLHQYAYVEFDPDTPRDEGEMDPSRQFPLSPKEVYMYQGHYGGEPLVSPSKKQPPPNLPERRPDTQLGNRKSRTSSISSRSSTSSADVHYDPSDSANGHAHRTNNNNHNNNLHNNPQHQQHAHHHSPHLTPQQQQQQQLLTMQIQQQLQRQNSINKGSNSAEANNNNTQRPYSYAMGAGSSSKPPSSPSPGVDMRPRDHHRDASPYGARGNVQSDGAALLNHHHNHHQQHHPHQHHQPQPQQFVFTDEAIGHHDKGPMNPNHHPAQKQQTSNRGPNSPNAYGNNRNSDVTMRNPSDGVYGEFVRPSSSGGRPSLTFVPPPVVPTLLQQQNSNNINNSTQHTSSPTPIQQQQQQYHHHQNNHHHQQHHNYQQPQQQHHNHQQHQQYTNSNGQTIMTQNNNNNKQLHMVQPPIVPSPNQHHNQHLHHHQHQPSSPTPSSPNLNRNKSLYGPPNFPAPPPPVAATQQSPSYPQPHHQIQSTTQSPPPPPLTTTTTSAAATPPATQHHQNHHIRHPPKAPPSHTPPPPPGPPPGIKTNVQQQHQQRQPNLSPSGTRSPRTASPARQADQQQKPQQIHNQHRQHQVTATADELAQIKLRNVGDVKQIKNPASVPTNDSNTGLINFKLKHTPGNVNIYAEGETTSVLPPPLDDLDDLPPPPPPPELCPPSPPPPPPASTLTYDPHTYPTSYNDSYSYTTTNQPPPPPPPPPPSISPSTHAHTPPQASYHHAAHYPPSPSSSSTSSPSYLPAQEQNTSTAHSHLINTPSPGGIGNSYLLHHQHQHEPAAVTAAASPPLPPPSPPPPPPPPASASSPSSSSSTQHHHHHHQHQHPHQEHTASLDNQESSSSQAGLNLLDREKIIADSLAAMDWIPDDIDLSECPGLVEITKSTPNWKKEMIEKKNQEKIEEYVKQIMKKREQEAKWKNIPAWKRRLLEQKEKEEAMAEAEANSTPNKKTAGPKPAKPLPEEDMKGKGDIVPAALSIDPEELAAMPPWKRELLFKRDKVPITFSNEFNPDEDEEGGEGEGVSES